MELAGSTVLLTGATGGLGRAIATALAARGAKLSLSGRKAEALEALATELPGDGHRRCPATSVSRAPPSNWRPRPARSTSSSPTPACPARAASRLDQRAAGQSAAGQPRVADAARPGPRDRRCSSAAAATWSSSPRSRASRRPRSPPSTTRPSSACAASPSACAPTSTRWASASRSSHRGRFAKRACTRTPAPTRSPAWARLPQAGRGRGRQGDRAQQGRDRRRPAPAARPGPLRSLNSRHLGQDRQRRCRSKSCRRSRRRPTRQEVRGT